ncbi:hypothetical protein HHL17_15410 [Chitinophaga sp. G-6-1-13]|uniref:Uncharacterized protein n=1 Tax=Chitinophaga fulva TaxID=2728842 RepID=A0A848GJ19_9BACT|nr:hypothetical protein [Chitinophaga fulva]NML38595.1 hypothetical protein [Chitinophaga fulva]
MRPFFSQEGFPQRRKTAKRAKIFSGFISKQRRGDQNQASAPLFALPADIALCAFYCFAPLWHEKKFHIVVY